MNHVVVHGNIYKKKTGTHGSRGLISGFLRQGLNGGAFMCKEILAHKGQIDI